MTRILAAVADDASTTAVLAAAIGFTKLRPATVEALHVGDGTPALSAAAAEAGVTLRTVGGSTVEALAAAAAEEDVAAIVIGAGGEHATAGAAGNISLRTITLQARPVVVVLRSAAPPRPVASVLVPLDGTAASATAVEELLALARDAAVRIVIAHVHPRDQLPAFGDQISHEARAWRDEFLARFAPAATGATLESRVGEPREHLIDILRESGCDLVALAWSQSLSRGRASVVRRLLDESPVPVLLLPTRHIRPASDTTRMPPTPGRSSPGLRPRA